jgi:hypothetical protein
MVVNLNINQEQILPIPGMIDIQTMQNGYFTAVVDTTQATPIKAGQFVKLLSSNTGPYPKVVAAAQNDVAHGMIAFITKDAAFVAGDKVEITFFGGLVIFQQATAVAIVPGAQVESDATGLLIQASSGNKIRGYTLDYFPASSVARIIQLGILQSA